MQIRSLVLICNTLKPTLIKISFILQTFITGVALFLTSIFIENYNIGFNFLTKKNLHDYLLEQRKKLLDLTLLPQHWYFPLQYK